MTVKGLPSFSYYTECIVFKLWPCHRQKMAVQDHFIGSQTDEDNYTSVMTSTLWRPILIYCQMLIDPFCTYLQQFFIRKKSHCSPSQLMQLQQTCGTKITLNI